MPKEIKEGRNKIQIEDYESLIQSHAWVALGKIKKPTVYSFEDLYQEGAFVFLHARRSFRKDKRASFKTFLTLSLRSHFCSIIQKSYNSINHMTNFEESFFASIHSIKNSESLTTTLFHYRESFSVVEIKYVIYLLNTPKEIREEIRYHIGKRRQVIRRELQLTPYKETEIRKSIKKKLANCCV